MHSNDNLCNPLYYLVRDFGVYDHLKFSNSSLIGSVIALNGLPEYWVDCGIKNATYLLAFD